MTDAGHVACPKCGASLPFDGESWEIRCGYCATTSPVDPDVRERVRRFRKQLEQEERRRALASDLARQWDPSAAAPHAQIAAASAPCPSCGAQVWFRGGEPSVPCPHCRTTVLASTAVRGAIAHVAEQNTARAEAARERAERRLLRKGLDVEGNGTYWGIAAGGFGFSGFGVMSLLTDDKLANALVLFFIGGSTLVGTAIAWSYFTKEPRALRDEIRALNVGPVRGGMGPILDWLDAYWSADNPSFIRDFDVHSFSVAFGWRGRPACLVAIHDGKARMHVLLGGPESKRSTLDDLAALERILQAMC